MTANTAHPVGRRSRVACAPTARMAASCPPARWGFRGYEGSRWQAWKMLRAEPWTGSALFCPPASQRLWESRKASRRVWSSATKTHHKNRRKLVGLRCTRPHPTVFGTAAQFRAMRLRRQPADRSLPSYYRARTTDGPSTPTRSGGRGLGGDASPDRDALLVQEAADFLGAKVLKDDGNHGYLLPRGADDPQTLDRRELLRGVLQQFVLVPGDVRQSQPIDIVQGGAEVDGVGNGGRAHFELRRRIGSPAIGWTAAVP